MRGISKAMMPLSSQLTQ